MRSRVRLVLLTGCTPIAALRSLALPGPSPAGVANTMVQPPEPEPTVMLTMPQIARSAACSHSCQPTIACSVVPSGNTRRDDVPVGDGKRSERERRDNAEIAATAAPQRPEQVGMIVCRRSDRVAAGQYDGSRHQRVACQAPSAGRRTRAHHPASNRRRRRSGSCRWGSTGHARPAPFAPNPVVLQPKSLRARGLSS